MSRTPVIPLTSSKGIVRSFPNFSVLSKKTCVCISQRPGMRYWLWASMTVPFKTCALREEPTY
jgi:hypothetical protein